jgi:PAS domain S-box-containing protein
MKEAFMPTILAIDDKRDNLTTITALLKNLMPDCAVITALSGSEGIEKALAAQPDAVLLDINMPGMDGFETCRRLKADSRTQPIPVIMVTAVRSDAPSRIKGLDLGADAFLSKPIDEHELVSQIRVVLRIKEAENALRRERNSLETMVQERTAALRASEARFRAANDASLDVLLLLRSERDATGSVCDFVFVDLNRRAEELLRMGRAQLLGKRLCEELPINREAGYFDKYKRVVDTGIPLEEEFFLPETHVPAAWYYHQVVRVGDGIFICHRDISERKRSEEALQARESFINAVLEAIGANIAVLDRCGVITAVNGAWERFARENGAAAGGAATGVGVDYFGAVRAATGTSMEGAAEALAGLQAVVAGTNSLFTIDYPCHSPDQQRWFMLRATPLPGAAGGAVVAHIDITAHKQAEEALRKSEAELTRLLGDARQSRQALLSLTEDQQQAEAKLQEAKLLFESVVEHIPLMVFLKEATDLRFVIFNRAGEELLGHDRKAFLGLNDLDLFPPEQALHFIAQDREVLDGGVNVLDIPEDPIQTARKGERLLHTRKVCIRGSDGTTKYLLGISDDITDSKRAETERKQLQAQLIQSQKLESIGLLASGVAHEINNPIMGIMGYTQLIRDRWGATDATLLEYATEIGKETDRVARIVKNLLSFARQDNETRRSPEHLCDIIGSALSLIRIVLRQDHVTLEVDVPADLPETRCHSQQMQQVIMNLLTNARDALNQRYPGNDADKVVRISARIMNSEPLSVISDQQQGVDTDHGSLITEGSRSRRWLRLTVEDHGVGIPEAVRARIFDPFFTTKPRDKGTGLGLSISHGIVKDHGGELSVESEMGQWTRFHVDLPVAATRVAEREARNGEDHEK